MQWRCEIYQPGAADTGLVSDIDFRSIGGEKDPIRPHEAIHLYPYIVYQSIRLNPMAAVSAGFVGDVRRKGLEIGKFCRECA